MYLGEFQGEVSNLFWADHSGRTIVSEQRADIELFTEEGQGEEGFKQYRHFQLIIFWVSVLIAEIPNNPKLTHRLSSFPTWTIPLALFVAFLAWRLLFA